MCFSLSSLRSPEVILGLPISEAADMWSLGGVLATLYLGSVPFPQRCQYYLVRNLIHLHLFVQLHVQTLTEIWCILLADVILYILSPDENYGGDTGSAGGPGPR